MHPFVVSWQSDRKSNTNVCDIWWAFQRIQPYEINTNLAYSPQNCKMCYKLSFLNVRYWIRRMIKGATSLKCRRKQRVKDIFLYGWNLFASDEFDGAINTTLSRKGGNILNDISFSEIPDDSLFLSRIRSFAVLIWKTYTCTKWKPKTSWTFNAEIYFVLSRRNISHI